LEAAQTDRRDPRPAAPVPWPPVRARLATVLVLAAAASLAGLARADGAARGCRTVEKTGTTEAVFAHFATRAQADAFVNGVAAEKGFKGLVVEDDGCGDFEVENPSIRQGQRSALVLEAAQSALQISFEQTTPVDRPGRGF